MQIEGLNEEQIEMLDFMWTLDSQEEFEEWQATLDTRERQMSDILHKMVLLASIDDVMDDMKKYPDATELLKAFQL